MIVGTEWWNESPIQDFERYWKDEPKIIQSSSFPSTPLVLTQKQIVILIQDRYLSKKTCLMQTGID